MPGREDPTTHVNQVSVDTVALEESRFLGNPHRGVLRRNRRIGDRYVGELGCRLRTKHDVRRQKPNKQQLKPTAVFRQESSRYVERLASARRRLSAIARRKIALSAFFL